MGVIRPDISIHDQITPVTLLGPLSNSIGVRSLIVVWNTESYLSVPVLLINISKQDQYLEVPHNYYQMHIQ